MFNLMYAIQNRWHGPGCDRWTTRLSKNLISFFFQEFVMKPLFAAALPVSFATIAIPAIVYSSPLSPPSQNSALTSSSQAIDKAAIAVMINSVATFADQGNFESIEALYADEIQVDYTSLWDGDVQTQG